MINSADFVEKHNRNTKNAVTDYQKGVNAVTKSPTEQAAAKQSKMIANLTASVQSGKWAQGLKRVSLEEWKRKASEVGAGRIAAGVDAAADKVRQFADSFLPFLETVASKVNSMPDLTLEDSINRMTTQVREVAKFKR